MTYYIKPLKWRRKAGIAYLESEGCGIYYYIYKMNEGYDVSGSYGGDTLLSQDCKTLREAKAIAEAHYREALMEYLIPVSSKQS